MLRVGVGRQLCQSQRSLHNLLTMIRALFGVEIKDCAFVIGELCGVAQYFAVDERCSDNGGDIECLFALCLTRRSREIAECSDNVAVGIQHLRRSLNLIGDSQLLFLPKSEDVLLHFAHASPPSFEA